MLDHPTLYVVVESGAPRRIHAVCSSEGEAEEARREIYATMASALVAGLGATDLQIHVMNAVFPGDRYRLVYGTPMSAPSHPLDIPVFQSSRVTNTDAHSDAYLYPDALFVHRREALAAAARHNVQQLWRGENGSLDWAVVVEVGEPLWRRYHSECLVRKGHGWEETDLVRPVRLVHPTEEEVTVPKATSSSAP